MLEEFGLEIGAVPLAGCEALTEEDKKWT